MIYATVYDLEKNLITHLEASTPRLLFIHAQSLFGHCLGRLVENGMCIGWRFAHCDGRERCSEVKVLNVQLDEEFWVKAHS